MICKTAPSISARLLQKTQENTRWGRCSDGWIGFSESVHKVTAFGVKSLDRPRPVSSALSAEKTWILVFWCRRCSITVASNFRDSLLPSLSSGLTTYFSEEILWVFNCILEHTTWILLSITNHWTEGSTTFLLSHMSRCVRFWTCRNASRWRLITASMKQAEKLCSTLPIGCRQLRRPIFTGSTLPRRPVCMIIRCSSLQWSGNWRLVALARHRNWRMRLSSTWIDGSGSAIQFWHNFSIFLLDTISDLGRRRREL